MKRVGFISSPLSSGHAVRGVGFYTSRLLRELKMQSSKFKIEILEIANPYNLKPKTYDLVHYPWFDLFFHTLPIYRPYKTVVTIHDVIPLQYSDHYPQGLRGSINLGLQKLALRRVDRVITVSQAAKAGIIKSLSVYQDKIDVIYEAADTKFKKIADQKVLNQVKTKYRLPDKFVLYVGDVNWNKNIPNLVKACEQINYPLVVVGKQAAEIEKLDLNHAELRHLREVDWRKVMRFGFVPDADLVAIYNLAMVYCQPSFAEGFGLPVLEAIACSTAVACSNSSSLPEIAGKNAVYFNPYDIKSISQAIIKAMNHGPLIMNLSRFSWAKTAAQTLAVYTEIL